MQDTKNTILLTSDDIAKEIKLGFEWFRKERKTGGMVHNIDLWAIVVNRNGKITRDEDIVFYNNCSDPAHIAYFSDDYDDWCEGEDDSIYINLTNATNETAKIVIFADMYEAANRRQNFSQLTSFYMHTPFGTGVNDPIIFSELPPTTVMLLCEIKRTGNGWMLAVTGNGYSSDIISFLKEYGCSFVDS